MRTNKEFICVSGFFFSGSSAVVDLLKEYENTVESAAEIRIIKDPYGICDLEYALVDHWELINSSAAINDFLWLCRKCSRRGGKFPLYPAGLSYNQKISPYFMKITEEYIKSLSEFTYLDDNYHQKFKKSYLRYVIDRCRWAIEYLSKGKIKVANRRMRPSYFAHPTKERFYQETRKYIGRLFEDKYADYKYIILDQAVSPNNMDVISKYFNNAILIIVTRDPRDMYIDNVLWGVGFESDLSSRDAGVRFAKKQKALREKLNNNSCYLEIPFEQLVLNYEDTVDKIEKYIGFSKENHTLARKYFDPAISKRNISLWKKHYEMYKDALDAIEETIPEYCYNY